MTEAWQPQRTLTCCDYTAHLGQGASWECPACGTLYPPPQPPPQAGQELPAGR